LGLGQGCWVGRESVLVLGASITVSMLVNLESAMWVPALVTFRLCQPTRRGCGHLCLRFMCALHVAAVECSTWSVPAHVTSCVSVLCVSVHPRPSAQAETLGPTGLGSRGWAGGSSKHPLTLVTKRSLRKPSQEHQH